MCLIAVNSFFFCFYVRCNLHEGSRRLDIIRSGLLGSLRRRDPLALGDFLFWAKAISHLALFFFFFFFLQMFGWALMSSYGKVL